MRKKLPRASRSLTTTEEYSAADIGLTHKGTSLTTGRVLLRPHQHIADAPVACFVTALHTFATPCAVHAARFR